MANRGKRGHKLERHKDESKDGEINRLKKAIKRLQREKQQLISEVRTIEAAFDKNVKFLRGMTKDHTIEELIKAAKKEMTLKEIKDEKEQTFESLEQKWKCFKEGCTGVMKLLIFRQADGKAHYFRKCSNPKCLNRTKVQPYTEDVEGIK